MTDIKQMNLGDNELSGALPPQWANMTKIIKMRLHKNTLTGLIPPAFPMPHDCQLQDKGGDNVFGCPLPAKAIARCGVSNIVLCAAAPFQQHIEDLSAAASGNSSAGSEGLLAMDA